MIFRNMGSCKRLASCILLVKVLKADGLNVIALLASAAIGAPTCANTSAYDHLKVKKQQHTGGIARIFEIEATKKSGERDISTTEVDVGLDSLLHNYGRMGEQYARYLASNHVAIAHRVRAQLDQWKKDVKFRPEERMWAALNAAIIIGAELGREMGVPFHVERISEYLYEQPAPGARSCAEQRVRLPRRGP
jgi:hypothetical protein